MLRAKGEVTDFVSIELIYDEFVKQKIDMNSPLDILEYLIKTFQVTQNPILKINEGVFNYWYESVTKLKLKFKTEFQSATTMDLIVSVDYGEHLTKENGALTLLAFNCIRNKANANYTPCCIITKLDASYVSYVMIKRSFVRFEDEVYTLLEDFNSLIKFIIRNGEIPLIYMLNKDFERELTAKYVNSHKFEEEMFAEIMKSKQALDADDWICEECNYINKQARFTCQICSRVNETIKEIGKGKVQTVDEGMLRIALPVTRKNRTKDDIEEKA